MSSAKEGTTGPRPRVLVAEDEALIRLDLVELLEGEGYEVVGQAGDGEEAVEKARQLQPDLVVMGTHGRKLVDRVLLGSVAEKTVRLSKVPVMTVRIES